MKWNAVEEYVTWIFFLSFEIMIFFQAMTSPLFSQLLIYHAFLSHEISFCKSDSPTRVNWEIRNYPGEILLVPLAMVQFKMVRYLATQPSPAYELYSLFLFGTAKVPNRSSVYIDSSSNRMLTSMRYSVWRIAIHTSREKYFI